MLRLSGDHAMSPSDPLVNVICRGSALPSFGTIQRSDDCSFSSYDGLVTEKTVHLPSALGAGPPTRFISHIVSCVSARLDGILMFCAASDTAASARKTVVERMCRSMRHIMAERQTALITGASSGIGADLARLFARHGYELVLVARGEAKLRELGLPATIIAADLTDPAAPQRIVEELRAKSIDVDVLVNNAGVGVAGAFLETDLRSELAMIQLNVVALTHLTRLLLPGMVARRGGHVLNVASTAAFQPGPLMAVYYATKA